MPPNPRRHDRHHRDDISRIVSFANWSIWGVTAIIATVFAGITLKDVPFNAAISNTNPVYFQALVLSVYIWCWAAGTSIDTRVQGAVYLADPSRGRVRPGAVAAVASLTAVFIVLVLTRWSELYFAIALLVFSTADFISWLYLRYRFMPPLIETSRQKYQQDRDSYGELLLEAIVRLIAGNWKWWRFGVLFAIVLLMVVCALLPVVKDAVSGALQRATAPVLSAPIAPLLADLLFLLFVLVSELWLFAFRLKTLLVMNVLNELEQRFTLWPLPD